MSAHVAGPIEVRISADIVELSDVLFRARQAAVEAREAEKPAVLDIQSGGGELVVQHLDEVLIDLLDGLPIEPEDVAAAGAREVGLIGKADDVDILGCAATVVHDANLGIELALHEQAPSAGLDNRRMAEGGEASNLPAGGVTPAPPSDAQAAA